MARKKIVSANGIKEIYIKDEDIEMVVVQMAYIASRGPRRINRR